MATDRNLDIVVFGATSFVGQIICRHLVDRHGSDGPLRWAIAGRNESKLAEVAAATGAELEQVVADAGDAAAMAALAESTRLVISTVGPYALYGSELVAACAEAGTDYLDITGEPQWIRAMIDAHQDRAEATGARIVNSCGFDSIPSDLGLWFIQQAALDEFGAPCITVAMRVAAMRGGASGGTIASGLNAIEQAPYDPELRSVLANPYALAPDGQRRGVRQPNVMVPCLDHASGQWVAPFVMAGINTKIVHRTHALLGRPWGDEFRYDEAMLMGSGPVGAAKAAAVGGSLAGFLGLAAFSPTRSLLERFVLPKPGEGPSPSTQEAGYFDLRFFGTTAADDEIVVKVTGDRDPGYGSTAKMIGEAAIVLLDADNVGGGFWTPASAMGDRLIHQLESHAGLTFEVHSITEAA